MNWRNKLVSLGTRKGYNQFIKATKTPDQAQQSLWDEEIKPLIKQSDFWQDKFKASLQDYPITEYEDYQEALEIAKDTVINPLNRESILFWSETSGTSGNRKFFPITKTFKVQFQRTMAPFLHHLTQRFPSFFQHPMLYLTAVDPYQYMPSGIPSGWISNFNYRNMSPLIRKFYALPFELMTNGDLFKQWAPLYVLATDLTSICAVTPMVIDDFYQSCQLRFPEFYDYLVGNKKVPNHLPALKMTKARNRYLKSLNPTLKHDYKTLWPGLAFGCCWTSGLCAPPAEKLQKQLGNEIKLIDGTYSATEGWITVPLDNDKLGGVIHPGAHIFEFIEEGKDIHPDNLIPCNKLEVGKRYEIFLTTAMGFIRYHLKDIIECTGTFNNTPWIEFCCKSQLLKLEYCTLTSQEIESMLADCDFDMDSHWYFARNGDGNKLVLITDDAVTIVDEILKKMHLSLEKISPTYAYGVKTGEVLAPTNIQVTKEELLKNKHAQTKPKLIDHQQVW